MLIPFQKLTDAINNNGIKYKYFFKFDLINDIKSNGILIINTVHEDMNAFLPNNVKKIIKDNLGA